jgi:hypothetical protein
MKFYKQNDFNYYIKIKNNKLTAIYCHYLYVCFYKNGNIHNVKNAAFINENNYKKYFLNDQFYGNKNNFTKETWRIFVKLKAFL